MQLKNAAVVIQWRFYCLKHTFIVFYRHFTLSANNFDSSQKTLNFVQRNQGFERIISVTLLQYYNSPN